MEDVLDLYAQPIDPERPLVCFDEKLCVLISDVHEPIPATPKTEEKRGKVEKQDYEYEREGSSNLFAFFAPYLGWRHIKVTERRTKVDFAHCMKELVDVHFPEAVVIKLVMDNLNTHTIGALYEVFEPSEARRIAKKLEIHHTPKHGSWLNMVECELSGKSTPMPKPENFKYGNTRIHRFQFGNIIAILSEFVLIGAFV